MPESRAELLARAVQIRDEFRTNANSPARVGGALYQFADAMEIGTRYDVTSYGATTGGSDATDGIQGAIDAAAAVYAATGVRQIVLFPPGRYGITPAVNSSWDVPLSQSTAEVHIGVFLKSGLIFDCAGATFVALPPTGAQSGWHYALFGTELNTTVGEVENVTFIRPRFDFTETYWTTSHGSLYAFIACGMANFEIASPEYVSTGTAAGFGGKILNSERVKIHDVTASNILQGHNFNYITELEISGRFDGCVEAVDIDAPCYRVHCDVVMTNGVGEAQALDISNVQNGYFRVQCEAVGNVCTVYTKPDGWQTFAEWVENRPLVAPDCWTSDPVLAKDIAVDFHGKDIHSADIRAIQLGLDRSDTAFGVNYWDGIGLMCTNVTLRGTLEDTDPILVYECRNIDLDVAMTDVTTGSTANVNNAAVTLMQETADATKIAESELSGRARIAVTNTGRLGVKLRAATNFELDATVAGYNSEDDIDTPYGVWVSDLKRKDGAVSLKNIRVSGGDTTVAPTDLRITDEGSGGEATVHDLGGHRLTTSGGKAIAFVGVDAGSHLMDGRNAATVPDLDTTVATGAATVDSTLAVIGKSRARIASVHVTNLAAIAGDASNYAALTVRRIRAGVTQTLGSGISYDNVARAAGAFVSLGVVGDETDGLLEPGDMLQLRATRMGTGSALTGLSISYSLLEYSA